MADLFHAPPMRLRAPIPPRTSRSSKASSRCARPGMYIAHRRARAPPLVAEVLDNAMDEAVHRHPTASSSSCCRTARSTCATMPRHTVDPHPKMKEQSALEVILTTLHSGAKFNAGVYKTRGRPARRRRLGGQRAVRQADRSRSRQRPQAVVAVLQRGKPTTSSRTWAGLQSPRHLGSLHPIPESSAPARHFAPARSTAWRAPRLTCSAASRSVGAASRACLRPGEVPEEEVIPLSRGLADYLASALEGRTTLTPSPFLAGGARRRPPRSSGEFAWPEDGDGFRLDLLQHRADALGGTTRPVCAPR